MANDEFFRDKAGWSELYGMFGAVRVGKGICSVRIFAGCEPEDASNEANCHKKSDDDKSRLFKQVDHTNILIIRMILTQEHWRK